jgi:hypothetical protein
MFTSHSPQEFISNCPTLCAHQILAMVLISLSAKSLPGHQANSSTQPPGVLSRESASFPLWRAFAPCIQVISREFDEKGAALFLELAQHPDNFFSPLSFFI